MERLASIRNGRHAEPLSSMANIVQQYILCLGTSTLALIRSTKTCEGVLQGLHSARGSSGWQRATALQPSGEVESTRIEAILKSALKRVKPPKHKVKPWSARVIVTQQGWSGAQLERTSGTEMVMMFAADTLGGSFRGYADRELPGVKASRGLPVCGSNCAACCGP